MTLQFYGYYHFPKLMIVFYFIFCWFVIWDLAYISRVCFLGFYMLYFLKRKQVSIVLFFSGICSEWRNF